MMFIIAFCVGLNVNVNVFLQFNWFWIADILLNSMEERSLYHEGVKWTIVSGEENFRKWPAYILKFKQTFSIDMGREENKTSRI